MRTTKDFVGPKDFVETKSPCEIHQFVRHCLTGLHQVLTRGAANLQKLWGEKAEWGGGVGGGLAGCGIGGVAESGVASHRSKFLFT